MDLIILFIYIAVLWVISLVVTVYDKIAAKKDWQRIRERTLLWLAALGGAGAMLFTMKCIRHKTKKKKFMIPLPVFLVVHLILLALFYRLKYVN